MYLKIQCSQDLLELIKVLALLDVLKKIEYSSLDEDELLF